MPGARQKPDEFLERIRKKAHIRLVHSVNECMRRPFQLCAWWVELQILARLATLTDMYERVRCIAILFGVHISFSVIVLEPYQRSTWCSSDNNIGGKPVLGLTCTGPIDAVYTWVNGSVQCSIHACAHWHQLFENFCRCQISVLPSRSDPLWLKKKRRYLDLAG